VKIDDDLVTIRTYALPIHAHADRAYLDGEGIPALVLEGESFLNHGLGEYKLIVPRFLEEQALSVINRQCGKRQYSVVGFRRWMAPRVVLACNAPMLEDEERLRTLRLVICRRRRSRRTGSRVNSSGFMRRLIRCDRDLHCRRRALGVAFGARRTAAEPSLCP